MEWKTNNEFFSHGEFEKYMASHLPPRSEVHRRKRRRAAKKRRRVKASNEPLQRQGNLKMQKRGSGNYGLSRLQAREEMNRKKLASEKRRKPERENKIAKNKTPHIARETINKSETKQTPEQIPSRMRKRKKQEAAVEERRFRLFAIRILTFLFILLPIIIILVFFYFNSDDRPANIPFENEEKGSFEQVEIEN